jgi:hypothetical protein
LPTVRQLAGDLSRLAKDASAIPAIGQILGDAEQLARYCEAPGFDVDVMVEPELDVATAQALDQFVQAGSGAAASEILRIQRVSPGAITAVRAGVPRSPVLVWVSAAGGPRDLSALEGASDDRPLVVLATLDPGPAEQVAARLSLTASGVEVVAMAQPVALTLEAWFRRSKWAPAADVMKSAIAARALETLVTAFGLAVEQEARGARAKRALANQKVARLPGRSTGAVSETSSMIRARVQRQFSDFGRGVEERFQSAFHSQGGEAWAGIERALQGIDALEREDRAKTTSLRLGAEAQAAWLADLTERLRVHCAADLVALTDMFRMLGTELERALSTDTFVAAAPQFQTISEERLHRTLRQQCVMGRQFASEVPRTGFFEYVMIARRYQMLLFMVISAFGLSALRTYREFTIPAAVLLLSIGGLAVFNSTRRERAESAVRELEKVREHLRGEARRMITDVQRAWTSLVTQHLSDQASIVGLQLEAAIRESAAREAEELAQERQRVQRQVQSVETAERKLAALIKGRDTLMTATAQIRGELRQLLAAVRPLARNSS